jgi:hypothetical protein
MASHSRHVHSRPGEVRCQIKFRRRDLLWRHDGPLSNPHARRLANVEGAVLTVPHLPLTTPSGSEVGPTVLDMMVRQVVPLSDLTKSAAGRARAIAEAEGCDAPTTWPVWSRRDVADLWAVPDAPGRAPSGTGEEERICDHPFKPGLASGGSPILGGPQGWSLVDKSSTCSIAEHAYRLAVGMHGSVPAAYERIAAMAAAAWDVDRGRALEIWDMIGAAEGGLLLEDRVVERLRPTSSISQAVEREIMASACIWLGVDPNLDVRRPRGRPRAEAGDEGEIVRVRIDAAANVTGTFKRAYHDVAEGAAFASLDVLQLAEVLGRLIQDGLGADADLVLAYLDAAAPDWRERAAAAAPDAGVGTGSGESPCDVLGVLPDTPMAEVAVAFRTQMQAAQHLPNSAPMRRLTDAYKTLKRQRGART